MSALLMNKSVASGASLKASTRSVGRITPAPARRSVAAQAAREMWYPGGAQLTHSQEKRGREDL
eukprot:849137-Pelagomonas_calceolata.AAC.3